MKDFKERFIKAAERGDERNLKSLLLAPEYNALIKGTGDMTTLIHAARGGHEDCIRLLLPVSDALSKDTREMTALMWAARGGYKTCVGLLLPVSNALAQGGDGMTALMHATWYGDERWSSYCFQKAMRCPKTRMA